MIIQIGIISDWLQWKLISVGHNHKEIGEILGVSYRTINRWAEACEREGLNGLIPNFSGGKSSKLSEENKVEFWLKGKM